MTYTAHLVTVSAPKGRLPRAAAKEQRGAPKAKFAGKAPDQAALRYIYPPPLAAGDQVQADKLPPEPYPGAPSYMRSIFYYWWAFLRENQGYIECCQRGGIGDFADIYADFGDVRSEDFWQWWCERGYRLFHEPAAVVDQIIESNTSFDLNKEYVFRVPKALDCETVLKQLRGKYREIREGSVGRPNKSEALYKVSGKFNLASMHRVLMVLRAKRAHPDASNAELFDLAGLPASYVVEKSRDVSRLLKQAQKFVDNAARGAFPKTLRDWDVEADSVNEGEHSAVAERTSQGPECTPYREPPEIGETLALSEPRTSNEYFAPEYLKDRKNERQLALGKKNNLEQYKQLLQWHKRVENEPLDDDWSFVTLPELDRFGGGRHSKVLIFTEPSPVAAAKSRYASMLNSEPEMKALYRMAVLQNRLPLHWCLVCAMFVYGRGSLHEPRRETHPLKPEQIADLLKLLPTMQAIVLVGERTQREWDRMALKAKESVRIWRCDQPTEELRKAHPERWTAIPRDLPTWHDIP